MSAEVIVVGAGLAGLACAAELHRAGIPVQVVEADSEVGGRLRTTERDGYLLDRGFQVLLTAYPEVQRQLDVPALRLGEFEPGALVRRQGRFVPLRDPLRRPTSLWQGMRAPIGSLTDKLRTLTLRRQSLRGSLDDLFARQETPTAEALRRHGFSPRMIDTFYRPFLGGVFLERDLTTSSRMMEFALRMFARGAAALPAEGMQAIPRQLAAQLPTGCLRTSCRAATVSAHEVHLQDGATLSADQVVVAVDGGNAGKLLGESDQQSWRSVVCVYFAAPESPLDAPLLVLNGDGEGPINNLCVPSDVQPGYARSGALVSVSVIGQATVSNAVLEKQVRAQLREWFGSAVDTWRCLQTDRVDHALPVMPSVPAAGPVRRSSSGVLLCGDYCSTPSIQGALASGRAAARAVVDRPAAS